MQVFMSAIDVFSDWNAAFFMADCVYQITRPHDPRARFVHGIRMVLYERGRLYLVIGLAGMVLPHGMTATAETEFCGEPSISLSL